MNSLPTHTDDKKNTYLSTYYLSQKFLFPFFQLALRARAMTHTHSNKLLFGMRVEVLPNFLFCAITHLSIYISIYLSSIDLECQRE